MMLFGIKRDKALLLSAKAKDISFQNDKIIIPVKDTSEANRLIGRLEWVNNFNFTDEDRLERGDPSQRSPHFIDI